MVDAEYEHNNHNCRNHQQLSAVFHSIMSFIAEASESAVAIMFYDTARADREYSYLVTARLDKGYIVGDERHYISLSSTR